MSKSPIIYALDFDGVICDSAIETSITGWKAAQGIWPEMAKASITEKHTQQFRHVRPILETGYEAILIMRLLYTGVDEEDLYQNYAQHIKATYKANPIDTQLLKKIYGDTRDQWIQQNEADWLAHNPLFSGIAEKLQQLDSNTPWYIITTKQERFVSRILEGHHIHLASSHIFGMDRNLNKQQVLQQLLDKHHKHPITFIEDRQPTLQAIGKNPALNSITLQLVDWGYNTPEDRVLIKEQAAQLIGLDQFLAGN